MASTSLLSSSSSSAAAAASISSTTSPSDAKLMQIDRDDEGDVSPGPTPDVIQLEIEKNESSHDISPEEDDTFEPIGVNEPASGSDEDQDPGVNEARHTGTGTGADEESREEEEEEEEEEEWVGAEDVKDGGESRQSEDDDGEKEDDDEEEEKKMNSSEAIGSTESTRIHTGDVDSDSRTAQGQLMMM